MKAQNIQESRTVYLQNFADRLNRKPISEQNRIDRIWLVAVFLTNDPDEDPVYQDFDNWSEALEYGMSCMNSRQFTYVSHPFPAFNEIGG